MISEIKDENFKVGFSREEGGMLTCRQRVMVYFVSFHREVSKQVTWCFTPSQPLRLYQGDIHFIITY